MSLDGYVAEGAADELLEWVCVGHAVVRLRREHSLLGQGERTLRALRVSISRGRLWSLILLSVWLSPWLGGIARARRTGEPARLAD